MDPNDPQKHAAFGRSERLCHKCWKYQPISFSSSFDAHIMTIMPVEHWKTSRPHALQQPVQLIPEYQVLASNSTWRIVSTSEISFKVERASSLASPRYSADKMAQIIGHTIHWSIDGPISQLSFWKLAQIAMDRPQGSYNHYCYHLVVKIAPDHEAEVRTTALMNELVELVCTVDMVALAKIPTEIWNWMNRTVIATISSVGHLVILEHSFLGLLLSPSDPSVASSSTSSAPAPASVPSYDCLTGCLAVVAVAAAGACGQIARASFHDYSFSAAVHVWSSCKLRHHPLPLSL